MGCCSSSRPKTDDFGFKTLKFPEINLSIDDSQVCLGKALTISISEVKLSKVFEKITSFPCCISIIVESPLCKSKSEIGDVWNYVNPLKSCKRLSLRLEENEEELKFSLISAVEDSFVEIGSALIDLCAIDTYFKGIVTLYYRCLKSVFLTIEIQIGEDLDFEQSLSFSSPTVEKQKFCYYPSRDYPIDMKKYFTPNFSNEKWNSGNTSLKETTGETVYVLKDPKTPFCELKEFLLSPHAEFVYYTLERFKYFASQTVHANIIIQELGPRLKEIVKVFANDKLIIEKCLWVIFELSKSLENTPNDLIGLLDHEFILKILEVPRTKQIAALAIEIINKAFLIPRVKNNGLLYSDILKYCLNCSSEFYCAEICAGIVYLLLLMISGAGSQDSVIFTQIAVIFTEKNFRFLVEVEKSYVFNFEIILNSLKISKLFLAHKKFKLIVIECIGVKHLLAISRYYSDQEIQKLVLNIVKEIIGFSLNSDLSNDIHSVVIEILKNNSDNISITESSIGVLKAISGDIINQLVSEESIEMYCVLFICMKGELEFEMQLLGLFKKIKDFDEAAIKTLRKNKKIENCINDLLENYSIASTGSQNSNEFLYLKLKVLAEEVLGISGFT